jgi:arginyl-tRNA synthetase
METSAAFHRFYHRCRVVGDDIALSRARLQLSDAARIVIRNGLTLMGVAAPERMERAAEAPA